MRTAIRSVEFTPNRDGDSAVLPELLDQIPKDEEIGIVTGYGAYDARRCHAAIVQRRATAVIPIRRNGRTCKEDGPAARARSEPCAPHAIRPSTLEAMDRLPRSKPHRGEDTAPQGCW